MANCVLEAKDVIKIYGDDEKTQVVALNKVSLNIYEGDFITVMGPSGAGKPPSGPAPFG